MKWNRVRGIREGMDWGGSGGAAEGKPRSGGGRAGVPHSSSGGNCGRHVFRPVVKAISSTLLNKEQLSLPLSVTVFIAIDGNGQI